jgi:serine/threonine-protein kinase
MKSLIKIPLYIITLLVLGLVSGHFTFQFLSHSKTTETPNLLGKSAMEANDIARSKGLYLRIEGDDFDASVPQGGILRQDIPPGNKVKEGREIRVLLSRGPRFQYAPDVVGQTVESAQTLLAQKGIRIGKVVYVHSTKEAKDTIMAQRPDPNEKGGEVFSVLVSLGDYFRQDTNTP